MFDEEFYPTPSHIVSKMLAKISDEAQNFLDPSAGSGAIAEAIKRRSEYGRHNYRSSRVDCIESNPELAAMLVGKGLPVIGYDWLTHTGVSFYDAIVMNPPFSNGDAHLLKAWDFMYDGEIVCLLNAETVRNPHTAARQRLAGIIREHGSVEDIGQCFKAAARQTDVEVVMVYLRKKGADEDLRDLWSTDTQEKAVDDTAGADELENMLAVPDMLGNLEHYYNMASEHMQKAFSHIRKASLYLKAGEFNGSSSRDEKDMKEIMELALGNVNHARAEWARKHRRDAWMTVFGKMQFHKWLDKKQREQFLRDVETNANIPFTADNIKGTLENVILQRKRLFEQSCANVFDELTKYFNGNTNHREGWKSNDNYIVNEKLVFPWGCRYEKDWGFSSRYDSSIDIYDDLDRCLAVLDGRDFESILTIGKSLDLAFDALKGRCQFVYVKELAAQKRAESSYFKIRFFQKGTVHLEFRDRELWGRFNQTATAGKRWLGQNTNGRDEFPGRKTRYATAAAAECAAC